MTTDNEGFSINAIISEVTKEIGDESFRFFSYGWYLSRGRDAMSELGIDTGYFVKPFDIEMPKELAIKIPQGIIDIKELFLWDGDCFSQTSCANVYFKSGFTRRLFVDNTQFEKNKALDKDPYGDMYYTPTVAYSDTRYYAGLQNNHIVFSDSCAQYPYIRIVASVVPVQPGDEYGVPEIFRRAISLYMLEKATKTLKNRDVQRYRPIWTDYYQELHTPINGVWDRAKTRARKMNTKNRRDISLNDL